jgi:hypothetical protein
MKPRLKKIICYFFGHKYNDVAFDYGAWECFRCKKWGYEDLGGDEFYQWITKRTWKIRRVIKNLWQNSLWKIQQWKRGKDDDSVPF